jgi:hypothetical protein
MTLNDAEKEKVKVVITRHQATSSCLWDILRHVAQ